MRVMLHVKAFHLNSSSFQCRLCFFSSACFETIRQHLVAHHKMERNYHVAIEIKATFGPKIMPEQANPVNGLSFSPLPSLPIVKHPSKTCKKVGVKMPRTPIPMPPESLHYNPPTAIGASRSTLGSFKCPYCAIETTSTYDMEMHMKRHEVAMVDPCRFDEHSYLINQFTNLI
uniref:C2H2-type domain-containing protein n=1 Tax=Ciona savignyi TaxID=51511 RepID=H2Y9U5_CIOSA